VVEAGDEEVDAPVAPVRPVAVLDANILIPAGLRDLFLSCADVGVFRPVWQAEIENEVVRNTARLTVERYGLDPNQPRANAEATVVHMRRAFLDACAATELWTPLVAQMTCDEGPPRASGCRRHRGHPPGDDEHPRLPGPLPPCRGSGGEA